jgi:hypothetical protein
MNLDRHTISSSRGSSANPRCALTVLGGPSDFGRDSDDSWGKTVLSMI